jgi:hypothetical protein
LKYFFGENSTLKIDMWDIETVELGPILQNFSSLQSIVYTGGCTVNIVGNTNLNR